MKVVCAWCHCVISCPTPPPASNEYEPDPMPYDGLVSHGICPECYAKEEAVLEAMGPHGHLVETNGGSG